MTRDNRTTHISPVKNAIRWNVWLFGFLCLIYLTFQLCSIQFPGVHVLFLGVGVLCLIPSLDVPFQNRVTLLCLLGTAGGVIGGYIKWNWQSSLGLGLATFLIMTTTRGALQYLSNSHRDQRLYGFWLLGATTLIATLEIASTIMLTFQTTIDLIHWILLGASVLVILTLATPFFILKRPGIRIWKPDTLWIWFSLSISLATALMLKGHWIPAVLLLGVGVFFGLSYQFQTSQ